MKAKDTVLQELSSYLKKAPKYSDVKLKGKVLECFGKVIDFDRYWDYFGDTSGKLILNYIDDILDERYDYDDDTELEYDDLKCCGNCHYWEQRFDHDSECVIGFCRKQRAEERGRHCLDWGYYEWY